jgi:uncharacterized membrane protein
LLKKDLAEEVLEWVEDDLITPEQATKICVRYDVDFNQIRNNSIGYNILMGLGVIFIGLAAITLIGANWQDIPRGVRMWGLIFLTMFIQGWGLIKYDQKHPHTSLNFFFLGNILYGTSIILIAQIYHLGEHMPDGIFWWAVGCLPIALLLNSSWLTIFSSLLGLLWFILESEMKFYPYLFPIFILASLLVLLRGKQNILLFLLTLGSVGLWLEYTLSWLWSEQGELNFYAEHFVIGVAFFILIDSCSHFLKMRESHKAKDYAVLLSIWSLRLGLLFMLTMSFSQPWEQLIVAGWNHFSSMLIVVVVFLGLSAGLAVKTGQTKTLSGYVTIFAVALVMVIILNDQKYSLYLQIFFNISLIWIGIRLIFTGINRGISHHFFLGIVTISTTALVRYIDLVGNYIGASILFAFFSLLLLGSAIYWKKYLNVGDIR